MELEMMLTNGRFTSLNNQEFESNNEKTKLSSRTYAKCKVAFQNGDDSG